MRTIAAAVSLIVLAGCGSGAPTENEDQPLDRAAVTPAQSEDAYYISAKAAVDARADGKSVRQAKNIILFIGDGMGISTVTAARIYAGQEKGIDGESYRLAMEKLPQMALSKTYSHDFQVSDSAATATAMVAGLKSRSGTLGVSSDTIREDCDSAQGNGTDNLFDIAERAGLATGIVSTTRITHATPASTFAESPSRGWEDDSDIPQNVKLCRDIASQLIDWPAGDGFEVVLGGGRQHFLPTDISDPEEPSRGGQRSDGRNLIDEWQAKSDAHEYVWNAEQFAAADFSTNTRVLGLFERSHMQFELDRAGDTAGEPSIAEMTAASIARLSQNEDGYILMVEGGRIDHGHHGTNAARALVDAVAFDDAVAQAAEMTNPEDTLIIVTADHSHTLTISGYPHRGNAILGKVAYGPGVTAKSEDGKPYTTLGYANGPAACQLIEEGEYDCTRADLSEVDTAEADFQQQALVYLGAETHGGEDVAVFASGPRSELLNGVIEQHEIFHVIGRASGLVD